MSMLRKIRNRLVKYGIGKNSYSQCGEDLIIDFILLCTRGTEQKGNYIDIGAHHPTYLNNTFLFYKKGWTGINVDPIRENIDLFHSKRPKDTNVCAGVGDKSENKEFYVTNPPTLSTFDKNALDSIVNNGHKLSRVDIVEFLAVNDLISKYAIIDDIDLMTIDVEGNEFEIINSFITNGIHPKILVCETVEYSPVLQNAKKDNALIQKISELGYLVYADTFINTIFVHKGFW